MPATGRLRDMRNLGPASERMLVTAGVRTPQELARIGAAEAFRRVRDTGQHASRNLLWALEGRPAGSRLA